MNKIIQILQQPHPGYRDLRIYFRTVAAISIVVFLILAIFQPFHIGERNIDGNRVFTALVYAAAATVMMALNSLWVLFFPGWFDDKNWTLGKELFALTYQLITVAIAVWLINLYRAGSYPVESSYKKTLLLVFLIGILPYIIATIFRHNYLLKSHLSTAGQINNQLQSHHIEELVANYLNVPQLTQNIRLSDFLFAESRGNNLHLQLLEQGKLTQFVIRSTLTEFEQANMAYVRLFKCHRAFIINLDKIIETHGNAAGYEVLLHQDIAPIAVSRSKVSEFRHIFGR